MRVITGTARGRKLISPPGKDVRPTTDRVKEAVFSIVQFEIEGRRVLDLFAGSGQLGIEALSRGAAEAVFVEQSRAVAEIVRQNLKVTAFFDRARVVNADALSFLGTSSDVFDLAFLDPPYSRGLVAKALPVLCGRMAPGAAVVCETLADEILPRQVGEFSVHKAYRYAGTLITVYRNTQ
ncbi:MAG: 16S rRNA (guanine(966)-N(2))-methyltransferase RsmD [Oscillospiraceae bacterium]|nr:16S rRNA (guanine(966)-N(2))-methyltransferase RsmD [Oscillospiraceae bacterium]